MGLKMAWFNNPDTDQVEGDVTIPEHYNGYPGFVHGGIISAVLDETAGRTVMLGGDWSNLFVTLKLNVTFRQPTPTETPLKAIGWLVKEGNRSREVAAQLQLHDGTVTAECTAVIVQPPQDFEKLWEPERPFWKVDEE